MCRIGVIADAPRRPPAALRGISEHHVERERTRHVQTALAQLTPREREVLSLLAEGLDNQASAEQLFINPDTVRAHVVRLLGKLVAWFSGQTVDLQA